MGNYEKRNIQKAQTCYTCEHCMGLDIDYEECYKGGYCMLDVPQADIEHVVQIEAEGEKWDEQFCNTMGVQRKRGIIIEDSPRFTDPDDVCQFYEKRVEE